MRKFLFLVVVAFLLTLLNSCVLNPKKITVLVVKSSEVNIRAQNSSKSKILGQLSEGDTILPVKYTKNYIGFMFQGDTAYIYSKNLKPVRIAKDVITKKEFTELPEKAIKAKAYIEKFTNWETRSFWILTLSLTALCILFRIFTHNFEMFLLSIRISKSTVNTLPVIMIILGMLFGLSYAIWEMETLRLIFIEPFWLKPYPNGRLSWILRALSLLSLLSIAYALFKDIRKMGVLFPIRSIFYLIYSFMGFSLFLLLSIVLVKLIWIFVIIFVIYSYLYPSKNGVGSYESPSKEKEELIDYGGRERKKLKEEAQHRRMARINKEIDDRYSD